MPLVQTDYGLIYNDNGALCATLRPGEGRFGGAVAVEEGTENLLSESAFDRLAGVEVVNINGWSRARRITRTSGNLYNTVDIPCDADTEYTMSIYARGVRISPGSEFRIYMGDDGDFSNESLYIQPGSEWQRYVLTRRTSPNATRITRASIHLDRLAEGDIIEIADWQLETKPFATSFVDGTRAGGRLSYPKSLIAGLNALTVAAWTSGPPYWVSGNKYLVAAQSAGAPPYGDHFALQQDQTNNRIRLLVGNDANSSRVTVASDNVWDGNWHLIVGVINKSPEPGRQPIELYVDGELVASNSNVNAVPDLSNIDETWGVQVGHWRGSNYWNGLIDELLILPYAADEQEIQSWYQNGITHVRKPGYYASFDDSLALQYWSEVTYDYRVQNNRVIFERPPKDEDNILVFYETAVPNEDEAGS